VGFRALTVAAIVAASPALAQTGVDVAAARRDTVRAGATVTVPFSLTNRGADSVTIAPGIDLPDNWTLLMGSTAVRVPAFGSTVVIVSAAVPARTPAGMYQIVLSAARHAVDVSLVDRPGFVVAGHGYEARFLVRNRGNALATLRLSARSNSGVATLSDSVLSLEPDVSRVVAARVVTPALVDEATDDVVELLVRPPDDSTTTYQASSRVSVVPEPSRSIERYQRIPTMMRLRAASSDGISPFEIVGGGAVRDGGSTRLDFLLRGPTSAFAPFGDRDEYQAQLSAPGWRLRAGDHFYYISQLSSPSQPGAGFSAEGERGIVTLGGHAQQFRRDRNGGSETGAFLALRPTDGARVAVNAVNRLGGLLAGSILGTSAELSRGLHDAELEVARSDNPAGAGWARAGRLSGAWSRLSYDIGHSVADTGFAGSQRGASHNYVNAALPAFKDVTFNLSGSAHRADMTRSTGVPYVDRLSLGSLATTFRNRYTVELTAASRGATVQSVSDVGRQHGARLHAEYDASVGTLSFEGEAGRARDASTGSRTFTDLSLALRWPTRVGAFTVWGERYSGGSVTKGLLGTTTLGGDAAIRVSTFDVAVQGYASRTSWSQAEWHTQLDASIGHSLPNGSTVTLRARLLGGGILPPDQQSVAYLEYGMPLRLPVSRLRTPGRVVGRVVDAVSQQGVPGALVRLGPQIAITDEKGNVAFAGVPGGEHRVSMSQETSFAHAVLMGDPVLIVDSTRAEPTSFQLAIARGARVDVRVRRYATTRTAVGESVDSLTDAGAVPNAVLVLTGARDTLIATADEAGRATFSDVPPGTWTLSVRSDPPAYHRFDPDRADVTLVPGETRALDVRLVPRRREIRIIGTEQELRAMPSDPKRGGDPRAPAVRTGKPNQR
jgi:hypothetical protein